MMSRFARLTIVLALISINGLSLTSLTFASTPDRYHDYCIVGAGPSGLQLGYFLERANRDYMIFERSNISGDFFVTYPRHRTLISINKRSTGKTNKEFNLRHDWNSLLSDDESLLFTKYSEDLFPHADRLVEYFNDYQRKLGLRVQFHTEVSDIHSVSNHSAPDGVLHAFSDQRGNLYHCKVVVIATGQWKPNIPNMQGVELTEGYENVSLDPRDYVGKAVLILGHGNSAFEMAQGIYGSTSLIHMFARSPVRLAWQTHYVGDLRAVNVALLDTYMLKSLDGVAEGVRSSQNIRRTQDGKLTLSKLSEHETPPLDSKDNLAERGQYDKVIRCLGFTFDTDIFRNRTGLASKQDKFLRIHHNYELQYMTGVFAAGAASHTLDYRKSAGGFIHGFRYTARALSRLLEWRYEGVPWPSSARGVPMKQLMNVLLHRINEASGLYQMFQVLGDVVLFSQDNKTFDYLEEFPIELLPAVSRHTGHPVGSPVTGLLVLVMQYGANFSGRGVDTLRANRANLNPARAYKSNFLHPVLYYYASVPTAEQMANRTHKEVLPRPTAVHHVVEDFHTTWDAYKNHATPIRHFLENVTSSDLRLQFAHTCFRQAMTFGETLSPACSDLTAQRLTMTPEMAEFLVKKKE